MLPDQRDHRLNHIGLNVRLGYLAHVPEQQVAAWIERLEVILEAGASCLPANPSDHDGAQADVVQVYAELEDHGFPHLVAFQRETGKQALLAAVVLLAIERGNRDGALEAWARLRYFRVGEIARKADSARVKRLPHIRQANAKWLLARRETAANLRKEAAGMRDAGWGQADIVAAFHERTGLTKSQIRKILKK